MPSDREKLEAETLENLADRMQDGPESGRFYYCALAELERRRAKWQLDAANSQMDAAHAAKETAEYTMLNAWYMKLSVVAIAITSGLSALFQFLSWWMPR
jgi:hypothetical protein